MLVLLYLISFAILSAIILSLSLRNGILHYPIYFFSYLAMFHILIPLLFMVFGVDSFPVTSLRSQLPLLTTEHYVIALILIWIAAMTFPLGWALGGRLPLITLRPSRGLLRDQPERQTAVLVSWVILALGTFGFFLYFNAFGGIFRALEVAREFRTGRFEISNPFSFMRPFGDFTKVAVLLFIALWLERRRTLPVGIGFLLALCLSFLMLFFQGGRLQLTQHAALILIIMTSAGYLSVARAVVILLVASLLLLYGYQILFFIYGFFTDAELIVPRSVDQSSPLEFFIVELSFPSIGLATAMNTVEKGLIELRYGVDIIYGILSIIPTRFLDLGFDRITVLHTAVANPGGLGGIPVDMMGYGIYTNYIFGPVLFAFLVGFFTRLTFRYLDRITWPRIRFVLKLYFMLWFARSLVYFDPVASINSMYFLVFCAIIIYICSRWSLRRNATDTDALGKSGAKVT
ncbi:MAG: hypothetical protein JJU42_03385 [Rhodobacteraceae bacterium]|nr:hypothetical protein [Paracoccaceae bacterium]